MQSNAIPVSALSSSGGQSVGFSEVYVPDCTITNTGSQAVQYALDGSNFQTLNAGQSATVDIDPGTCRVRKGNNEPFVPAQLSLSWPASRVFVYADSGVVVGKGLTEKLPISAVVSSVPPNNADGRPNGTIYIQTA